jgi:ubiquinone/menaquinone biosynthesis C-methylase UbiE
MSSNVEREIATFDNLSHESERVRNVYKDRAKNSRYAGLYGYFNSANLFRLQTVERALLALLRQHNLTDLSPLHVLDVGCGSGSQLMRWISYGVLPEHSAGLDLMDDRIQRAQQILPTSVDVRQGDASKLPYNDQHFDIVSQFMLLSSILDKETRCKIAAEMLRVVRPGGIIISYDFWINPTNPNTTGIKPAEIRQLFPNCRYVFRCVTLAPPIAQFVVPKAWFAARMLENLRFLNSHYLSFISTPK